MKRNDVVKTINSLKGDAGHKKVVTVYNSQTPLPRGYRLQEKDPWCAATVSAVLIMNGYDEISECSCPMMVKKAKDLGIWVENDAYVPKVGDIVQYDWQDNGKGDNVGEPDHVGFVIKVDGDDIVVREGNKSNSIGNRNIKVNGKYIRGYILPPYEAENEEKEAKPINTTPAPEKSKDEAKSEVKQGGYVIGRTYTVSVRSALNVRRAPSINSMLVGYNNLSEDGKRHATLSGALISGTRVTCNDIKAVGKDVWMKIPSGWICAISGDNVYVK